MATNEERRAARDAKLGELRQRLTGAVEQLVSGDDWARALAFAAQFRSRSFNNTLLIWFQHAANYEAGRVPSPVPSYVAGYRQWQTLGRQVAKGQPGYMIYAPATGRRWSGPSPPTSGMRRKPPGIRSQNPRPRSCSKGKRLSGSGTASPGRSMRQGSSCAWSSTRG